ncbi:MAG: hypothetical protein KBS52_00550 [Clostridiales bacterium]|nr:hypothetical protein [Candidatus Equinaster intestinalis]
MKKGSQIFSFVFTIVFCLFAFALMTFFSVQKEPLATADPMESTLKNGEFYGEALLLKLPLESVFLDIDSDKIGVYFMNDTASSDTLRDFGFTVTKTVNCDYDTFADMVDCLGGIELAGGDSTLLFTGVQVAELIKSGTENPKKREITEKILLSLSNQTTGTATLRRILETAETDLSFPEGYDIILALPNAVQNINFINGEDLN